MANKGQLILGVGVLGVTAVLAYFHFRKVSALPKPSLLITAVADSQNVNAVVAIKETGQTSTTPWTVQLAPGNYTLTATWSGQTKTTTISFPETSSVRFHFIVSATVNVTVTNKLSQTVYLLDIVIPNVEMYPWQIPAGQTATKALKPTSLLTIQQPTNAYFVETGSSEATITGTTSLTVQAPTAASLQDTSRLNTRGMSLLYEDGY